MDQLKQNLKAQIIEQLNLEDVKPEDIEDNMPLFVEGLGLDSIDALELVVILEKHYGIKLKDPKLAKKVLYSVETMAEFIAENQKA